MATLGTVEDSISAVRSWLEWHQKDAVLIREHVEMVLRAIESLRREIVGVDAQLKLGEAVIAALRSAGQPVEAGEYTITVKVVQGDTALAAARSEGRADKPLKAERMAGAGE